MVSTIDRLRARFRKNRSGAPMKLGKLPARPGAIRFKFNKYANLSVLPTPPANFGFDNYVSAPWGMLGNDRYGDCVWAGADHETMLWTAEAGHPASFNDQTALSDYAQCTGFNPNDPSTDNGTDMQAAASYRRKIGVIDTAGNRHKIAAYVEIEPGNVGELLTAAWIFGTVGIGIQFPQSAMDQFNAGEPWYVVNGSPIVGGHYIPFVRRRHNTPDLKKSNFIVTWGTRHGMLDHFVQEYMDEGIAYLSAEQLTNGLTVNGFDMEQLRADLAALPT